MNTQQKDEDAGAIDPAHEYELKLFAFYIAVWDKTASLLGLLAFVWATTVLLGGFAGSLDATDFMLVTLILVVEGARICCRSQEIEWRQQTAENHLWPLHRWGIKLFSLCRRKLRSVNPFYRQSDSSHIAGVPDVEAQVQSDSSKSDDVPDVEPQVQSDSSQRDDPSDVKAPAFSYSIPRTVGIISELLLWIQSSSAITYIVLSLMRLIKNDFGDEESKEARNRNTALKIFYGLACSEGLVIICALDLIMNSDKQINKVCRKWDLGNSGMAPVRRFFYEAHSNCINGSIFDALKKDLVFFAMGLLGSDSTEEQRMGALLLEKFVMNGRLANGTLQKIGTSTSVIERLVEMLNWKDPAEKEIRKSAAVVISKLATKKRNTFRVAGITGSIESVSSLLPNDQNSVGSVVTNEIGYEFSDINLLGLKILKGLARDRDNCEKMCYYESLWVKIIKWTMASQNLLTNCHTPESHIKVVKRSLQVVKLVRSTEVYTEKKLVWDVSEAAFLVGNIREILQYGETRPGLQKVGLEILTILARAPKGREMIGLTDRMIELLLLMFFKQGLTNEQKATCIEAGAALAMLSLESKVNCIRILKKGRLVKQLVGALKEPPLQENSARILLNLCEYAGGQHYRQLKRAVSAAIPTVLNAIRLQKENQRILEVSLKLATQILQFVSPEGYAVELARAEVKDADIAEKLCNYTQIKVPIIRLLVFAMVVQMTEFRDDSIKLFKYLQMKNLLKFAAETTSECERFKSFFGITFWREMDMLSLAATAKKLIGIS